MPSQITHRLFAGKVLRRSLGKRGEKLIHKYPELIAWSAQGPDFFYHNQRTSPTAFKYGRILHRSGYGSLVYNAVRNASATEKGISDRFQAFLYPFITHAILDRYTHPFIIYFSGWREPGKKETYELYRMHAYFERIIDSHLCEGEKAHFFQEVPSASKHFGFIREILIPAIRNTYTNLNKPDLDPQRFRNACSDALFFYQATDCSDRNKILHAYNRDKLNGFSGKILALYYPKYYNREIDYLNEKHGEWSDPFYPEKRIKKSFYDLFSEALDAAVSVITGLDEILRQAEWSLDLPKEEIEKLVGNGNLSNGEEKKTVSPVRSEPLPLYEQLAREYCGVEKEFGLDQVFKYKQPVKGAVNCL